MIIRHCFLCHRSHHQSFLSKIRAARASDLEESLGAVGGGLARHGEVLGGRVPFMWSLGGTGEPGELNIAAAVALEG